MNLRSLVNIKYKHLCISNFNTGAELNQVIGTNTNLIIELQGESVLTLTVKQVRRSNFKLVLFQTTASNRKWHLITLNSMEHTRNTFSARSKRSVQKSSTYGLSVTIRCFSIFFGAFFFVGQLYSRSVLWIVLAPIVFGIGGYRLQFVLHDTSHYSLFKSKFTNKSVGVLAGLLVGVDFRRYRFTHMWHHRRNGEDSDPQFPDYLGSNQISRKSFLWFIASPLLGSRAIPYLKREMTDRKIDGNEAPKTSAIWWLAFFSFQASLAYLIWFQTKRIETLFLFYIGLATVSLFLARIRTLAEHQQISRTVVDFSRSHSWNFFDWLFLYDANFNLHLEHHLYPNLQTCELKKVAVDLQKSNDLYVPPSKSMVGTIVAMYSAIEK